MLKVEVVNKIKFPEFTLQKTLEDIAKDIIIPDMVRGIDAGMAINGGSLPRNDLATIKRKGHARPLIDTGELRRSFYYKLSGKSKVIISIENIRKAIGGYLQNDGVGKSNKHYLFFGISVDASSRAMDYARTKVNEQINGKAS
jgi:hypothetical protein